MSGISGVFNASAVSAANVKKRLTTDSVQILMHGNPTPKYKHNHHADNMRKLIEIQYQKQQEKAAAAEPAPEPFKLQRFAHVESRLAQSGLGRSPPKENRERRPYTAEFRGDDYQTSDSPQGGEGGGGEHSNENRLSSSSTSLSGSAKFGGFLRKKIIPDPTAEIPKRFVRPPLVRPASSSSRDLAAVRPKPAVPKASEAPAALLARKQQEQEEKDYLSANARSVMQPRQRIQHVDAAAPLPKRADYGTLPDYLKERKESWKEANEAKKRAADEALGCPPGHRIMPDEERLETLQLLKSSLNEAQDMLLRMPLRVEQVSQVRKKAELEAKITKLEDAMKVFGKHRVFVKE